MTDTIDRIVIQAESQGVKLATDQVDALRVAMDTTGKSGTTLENKFGSLERQLGTTAGQAQKAAKDIDTINKAVAQGNISQERANDAISAVALRYGAATKAAKELGDAHAGLSGQAQALQHAFRSTFDSLASGAPVTQVVGQEFGRLSYVMSGQGGVAGAFKELSGTFGGMITPMRLVAGGVAGLAAGALYLANSWTETSDKVNLALTGISQKTGTTATDVANFTKANATATGLSVAQARDAALEFTKTGNVTIANLKGVGEAIHGYALLTGKDATEATKAFTDALSGDLLKGIENLDQRYGSLNASTLEYIRTLIDSGDKTKALQVFMDSTAAANKRAEESVGTLTKAWQGFKNVVSNIASGPAPTSLEDQIAALQAQRAKAAAAPVGQTPGGYFNSAAAFGGKSQELDEFDKKLADLQKRLNEFNAQKLISQQDDISKKAFDATNAIFPQIDAIRKLDEAIKNIEKSQADGTAPANADGALTVYQQKRDAAKDSLDYTVREAEAVTKLKEDYGGVSEAVARQLNSLKDSTDMIKAQQNGTEASTAAAIAYKNAIYDGASGTEAAAIRAATLANNMAKAAQYASQFGNSLQTIKQYGDVNFGLGGLSPDQANGPQGGGSDTHSGGQGIAASSFGGSGGSYTSTNVSAAELILKSLPSGQDAFAQALNKAISTGGVNAAISGILGGQGSFKGDQSSTLDQLIQIKNGTTSDNAVKTANLQQELAYLQGQPETIARDQKIVDLNNSIQQLKTSTDNLNGTNQDLLSPYYSQDPRTSHIGFRSQGMATGGFVDVPGAPSSNDNMIAQIPVAGGERIYVDPMPSRRGGGGGGTSINISMPITIAGNANKDDVGRTMYQAGQALARQIAGAQR